MSGTPDWTAGISAKAAKAVRDGFSEVNRRVAGIEAEKGRIGARLRTILRHLKGNREAFEAAASELCTLGIAAAYEYVQAADATDAFAGSFKTHGIDPASVPVRSLAILDRFTGSEEKQEKGRAMIAAEVKAAKAENRRPFTVEGLRSTMRSESPATGGDTDRRMARIGRALSPVIRDECPRFEAVLQSHGPRAAFAYALRLGAEWGSTHGAATSQSLASLFIEWAANDRAAAMEKEKQDRAAAKVKEGVQNLTPRPKRTPKAAPKAVAAK